MSKARWADGLRRGSTKTKTYSTLSTRKEGRVQIIKDRVYDVANPQTISQMQQRVIFGTVTSAAKHMYDLISISQEGETKPEYARQLFISQNVEFLKSVVGRRIGTNRHYLAAYAPKNNQQLIPNSYIVSKGSLQLPEIFVVKTEDNKGSFGAIAYETVGELGAVPFGQYTVAQLWEIMFDLKAGDQLTFPQIYGNGIAQEMLNGSNVEDKTLVTTFCAPRIVLKKEMPTDLVTVNSETTAETIKAALRSGVSMDDSFERIVNNIIGEIAIDDTADDTLLCVLNNNYAYLMGVNGEDYIRALGVILSRKNSDGKWQYSTTQLCCLWDFIANNEGVDYFGFTIENAISTYLASAQTDANGNFLQRGGESDIVPESFG